MRNNHIKDLRYEEKFYYVTSTVKDLDIFIENNVFENFYQD